MPARINEGPLTRKLHADLEVPLVAAQRRWGSPAAVDPFQTVGFPQSGRSNRGKQTVAFSKGDLVLSTYSCPPTFPDSPLVRKLTQLSLPISRNADFLRLMPQEGP